MAATSMRRICLQVLEEWEQDDRFIDEILERAYDQQGISERDRRFVMALSYGVIRNRSLLDFWIGQLRDGKLSPRLRLILQIGMHQLFHMRVPEHAAVSESVALADARTRAVVNAVLRRALREQASLTSMAEKAEPAIRYSIPPVLFDRWNRNFGHDDAVALARWCQDPSPVYIRLNKLKPESAKVCDSTHGFVPFPGEDAVFRTDRLPRSALEKGLCYVQDPSTLLAPRLLDAQPGDRVLDACAAPGGKTAVLAEAMQNQGSIAACDNALPRLRTLRENLERMDVTIADVMQVDWNEPAEASAHPNFDRILIDTPCSNTGVLRRRVDARWRLEPGDWRRMPRRQLALLHRIAPLLKPGGALVYSTCSIERDRGLVEELPDDLLVFLRFDRTRAVEEDSVFR